MNTRERMRISNKLAREHLLRIGFEQIWLKSHTKFHDKIYINDGTNYNALDLFNLWDGIALREDGVWFLQIKTNAWAKDDPLTQWCTKYNAKGLNINVKLINNEYQVLMRYYE